jgi:hypothetical protein
LCNRHTFQMTPRVAAMPCGPVCPLCGRRWRAGPELLLQSPGPLRAAP